MVCGDTFTTEGRTIDNSCVKRSHFKNQNKAKPKTFGWVKRGDPTN